jgi:hypothetical protein
VGNPCSGVLGDRNIDAVAGLMKGKVGGSLPVEKKLLGRSI